MIPFLTKLANALDIQGKYDLAREIDDLVNKLVTAQQLQSMPNQLQSAPADAPSVNTDVQTTEPLYSIMGKVAQMASVQANDVSQDSQVVAKQLIAAFNQSAEYKALVPPIRDMVDKVFHELQSIGYSQRINSVDWHKEKWTNVYAYAQQAYEALLPQDVANKTKPTTKRKTSPLILEAQKLLNVKLSGVWDKATNVAFLSAMEKHYPKTLQDGKFQGDLKLAVQYLKHIAELNLIDSTKSPASEPEETSKWTSTYYDLSTSRVQKALQRLDDAKANEGGIGAQEMVNALEQQALAGAKKYHNSGEPTKYMSWEAFVGALEGKTGYQTKGDKQVPVGQTLPLRQ